jgi:formate dehydrogenase major subunit/NADH-quinone oxidoreductase subunit G
MDIALTIDGKEIRAEKGEKVLWAALDNGIYIPNLCAIRERKEPSAACRLCFVEIEGYPQPVTACTVKVAEGMVVHTNTPRAEKLRRSAFELIMSSHPVDCKNCAQNRNCELQKIAAFLKVSLKPRRLRKITKELPIDSSDPYFIYDPNKCVLCGRCVWVCHEKHGLGAIDFTRRGFDTVIAPFGGETLAESKCDSCCQCVAVCPTGALVLK